MKFRWVWWLLILGLAGGALLRWRAHWRLWHSQDGVIQQAARRYHLDPALIKAVVWKESRFNPRARGRAGEIGLMQLREGAAREWAEAERREFRWRDFFDPGQNTRAGAWYLKKLIQRYARADDPLPYALADYNAGRKNVLRWGRDAGSTNSQLFLARIDFLSTRLYIDSILRQRPRFRGDFAEEGR